MKLSYIKTLIFQLCADENKLYVPVIMHADEKSIKGIAREINTLATKARNKQLTAEDMQGGTW